MSRVTETTERSPGSALCDDPVQLELARIMDPVAFDPRAVPKNLGQSWDQFERRSAAVLHAERVLKAGWTPPPQPSDEALQS